MIMDPSEETPVPPAGVFLFHAQLLPNQFYLVDDGGEVSLVDRETLLLLLQQLFVKEKPYD
jgi:hypothetical protein